MSAPKGNRVEARHIHEATDEVRNWLDDHGSELDELDEDRRLVARLKYTGDLLLACDTAGDAEGSYQQARILASLALFYMARGLS
jgi:nuclear transport factor 2 (NTF2) superfamily protein